MTKEEKKTYMKAYREANKERISAQNKVYYEFNKEKIKAYCEANKEKRNAYSKAYYEANKEEQITQAKAHYKANKEKHLKTQHKRIKERRATDSVFKLKLNISSSISRSLKNKGYSKKSRTAEILKCDFETFYLWLEMNSFYKEKDKHIDHVIPISLAQTEDEIYILNHYTNFQYLPPEENISKGNRYIKKQNLQRVLDYHPNPNTLQNIINRSQINII